MKLRFSAMLTALLCLVGVGLNASAQSLTDPLPVDSAVRVGKLANGLTYLIRHNEFPKGQADFFIAQKVGSMQEQDNQRGLAHFLEHMCFNGTEHFPGNEIDNWLASKGVVNGRDQNAYTSFDETVYNISRVPVNPTNPAVEDSCLLILRDWAGSLLLTDKDIDEERGVIEQEWRMRNSGVMRLYEEAFPKIFPNGNRYGNRMPIGTMDIVLNFPYQVLRDYYHTWYHPDLQGIVVVGDIDVDRVETKIKEMFADLTVPADAPKREFEIVPDHKGMITYIGADPELPYGIVEFSFATDALPTPLRNTMQGIMQEYLMSLVSSMLNERLADIASKPDATFSMAQCDYGDLLGIVKGKDGLNIDITGKDGNMMPALETVYRELLRAQRGRFTEGELQRATAAAISALEQRAANKSTIKSTEYAEEYVRHFLDNDPAIDVVDRLEFLKMITPMITAAQINTILPQLITPDNRRLLMMLPQKEGVVIPTEAEIEALIAKVDAEDIEAFKEELRTDPLVRKTPVPGSITEIKQLPQAEAQEWTLSNGVTVIVKPTTIADDEIIVEGTARIGWAETDILQPSSVTLLPYLTSDLSAGDYSASDLRKYNSGKNVEFSNNYDDYETSIGGQSTVRDLPRLMEVIYAQMSDPNLDADEFEATTSQMAMVLDNASANPQMMMTKGLLKSYYADARRQFPTSDAAKAVTRNEVLNYIRSINSNAANFTFVFTGNIDVDSLKPLVETYLASLPAHTKNVKNHYTFVPELMPKSGSATDSDSMKMQTPQVMGQMSIITDMPFTADNKVIMYLISQILTERLNTVVRENMGATYSIGAHGRVVYNDKPNAMLRIPLMLKPEQSDQALVAIDKVLYSMTDSISAAEMTKAREMLVKDLKNSAQSNKQLNADLLTLVFTGVNVIPGDEAVALSQSITDKDIMTFMKQMLNNGDKRTYTLNPL